MDTPMPNADQTGALHPLECDDCGTTIGWADIDLGSTAVSYPTTICAPCHTLRGLDGGRR